MESTANDELVIQGNLRKYEMGLGNGGERNNRGEAENNACLRENLAFQGLFALVFGYVHL